ncbi:MAG: GNAT family N-acetyltransferase [Bdellovibrionales bacterium]
MKLISSEFVSVHSTYSFGYRNYVIPDSRDETDAILDAGYLPRLGIQDHPYVFYMARGARVPLAALVMTSENRRVLKKFDETVRGTLIPLSTIDITSPEFEGFFVDYFARHHGPDVMPVTRLRRILACGLTSHAMCYTDAAGETLGYVLLIVTAHHWYYWFSAYAPQLTKTAFGMFMMLDCARQAAATDIDYLHAGTLYGESGRYKTNLPGLQYWTGSNWSADMETLKKLLGEDARLNNLQQQDGWLLELGDRDGLSVF